jgi:hypothetical protein
MKFFAASIKTLAWSVVCVWAMELHANAIIDFEQCAIIYVGKKLPFSSLQTPKESYDLGEINRKIEVARSKLGRELTPDEWNAVNDLDAAGFALDDVLESIFPGDRYVKRLDKGFHVSSSYGVSREVSGENNHLVQVLKFDLNYPLYGSKNRQSFFKVIPVQLNGGETEAYFKPVGDRVLTSERGYDFHKIAFACQDTVVRLLFKEPRGNGRKYYLSSVEIDTSQRVASAHALLEQEKQRRRESFNDSQSSLYDKALKLAKDDDWLTGVGSEFAGDQGEYFYMIEKIGNQYSYSGCYSRYTETRAVKSITKIGDQAKLVEYVVSGVRLPEGNILSDDHLRDSTLTKADWSASQVNTSGIANLYGRDELMDMVEVCYPFDSGLEYWRSVDRENRERISAASAIPELILGSSALFRHFQIVDRINKTEFGLIDGDFQQEVYEVGMSNSGRSGYCGAAGEDGYYFVNFTEKGGHREIVKELYYSENSCAMNAYLRAVESDDQQVIIERYEDVENISKCFAVTRKDLSVNEVACPPPKLIN